MIFFSFHATRHETVQEREMGRIVLFATRGWQRMLPLNTSSKQDISIVSIVHVNDTQIRRSKQLTSSSSSLSSRVEPVRQDINPILSLPTAIMKTSVSVAALFALPLATTSLSLDGSCSRREALKSWAAGAVTGMGVAQLPAYAEAGASTAAESFNVDDFLRSGMVAQPMGVSGQAGKSKPETGVVLRDGSEVNRDPRTGNVLAEIIVKSSDDSKIPVLASYASPWPLATGTVFDVECRDPNTGDAAFLSVSGNTKGKDLSQLPSSFFVDDLFATTGRFSFYGQPTDIKLKKSSLINDNYRVLDISFSTLSQSTQAEIPRRARVVATIPDGTNQAVMLVASASANRWKKGAEQEISNVIDSFRATPAPQTSMNLRAKERRSSS